MQKLPGKGEYLIGLDWSKFGSSFDYVGYWEWQKLDGDGGWVEGMEGMEGDQQDEWMKLLGSKSCHRQHQEN